MRFEAVRDPLTFCRCFRALAKEDADALKPAELMRTIYERILSRMEADGFRVFQKRYRLSKAEKLFCLALLSILSGVSPPASGSGIT